MSASTSSAADARRKAEIEAKKAKLQEIRRQREERASRLAATASSSTTTLDPANSSRKDLDDLVNSLISAPGSSVSRSSRASIAGLPPTDSSPRKSLLGNARDPPSSDFGGSESDHPPASSTPGVPTAVGESRRSVELVEVETELFELPQTKARVYYTKEVQTASIGSDDDQPPSSSRPSGGVGAEPRTAKETEESLRARILAEHAEELASRAEEDRLERELAQQLRELTESERLAVYSAQDFSDFVEQSSKIVERALTDSYDYMRDYRLTLDTTTDASGGSQMRLVRSFGSGDKTFANRSVTAVDWSTKFPELVVVAYNRNDQDEDSPDGLVAVWNLRLLDRPEFVFHAQTDVLSVCFSPFHPNLVVGGTYSGQILIWDTRARSLPVLKTPLSAAGHTHPVYGLRIIGSANAHHLVSASTDGMLCWWMLDMLARPSETLELTNTLHPKTDEVAVTTLGLGEQETTSFLVGSEDGNVYAGNRYDRAGLKAGLNANEVYRGHKAPVTGIDFHPLNGAVDFSDLFLTSSMDWTSRLWRLKPAQSTAPLKTSGKEIGGVEAVLSFEESNDYIYDIKWSPTHPAIFAQVDGTGRLDVFNLNYDTERPIASVTPAGAEGEGRALNKLSWSKNGRQIATGGSDGIVYVYEVKEGLAQAGEEEFKLFQGVIARLLAAPTGPSAAGTSL